MNDDDLDAELDAYLDERDPLGYDPPPSGVTVGPLDERRVAGLLAKRARLHGEAARIWSRANERIDPIEAWAKDRTAGIESTIKWIDEQLERFAREMLPTLGRKSLPLPAGTLKLTAPGQPAVVVVDEGEFVAWCLDDAHPDRDELLRRTVAVEKAELKRRARLGPRDDSLSDELLTVFKAVDDNGEVVPGVRFTKPAVPRFSVTPAVYEQSDTRHEGEPDGV
jgi:hypothetical protein